MSAKLNELVENVNTDSCENGELQHLFYALWENKFLLIIVTCLVCALSSVYLFFRIPKYEANTLVQVTDNNREENFRLSQFHLNSGGPNETASQIALIQSRVILEPIINQLGLSIDIEPRHLPMIGHFLTKSSKDKIHISHLYLKAEYLSKHLKLKILDKTHYLLTDSNGRTLLQGETKKLIHSNSGNAIQIDKLDANPGAEFYIIKYPMLDILKKLISKLNVIELGDSNNNQTGILQISLIDTNPARLIQILNTIAKAVELKNTERKSQETKKTLQFLNEQLPIIKSSLEKAEVALNYYRATSGKIDLKIQAEQLMEQLASTEKQIIEANLYKSSLLQIYTKKYPLIIDIDNKVYQLKKLKQGLIQQIKALPASDQVAMNLMRDVKVKNDLYLVLLNKIQELRILNSGTLSDIKILAEATIPETSVPEQNGLVFTASLILGLMLGSISILIRNVFSRKVNDPQWVEKKLGIPNLAIVPYSKQQTKMKIGYKQKEIKLLPLLAETNPRDLSIEALRSLRTSFQIMITEAQKNIISIMGVSSNAGKSFVCSNFAYLLANVDKQVLLIDGDIRRGDLHKHFSLSQTPGLNELINDKVVLSDAIRPTSLPNLSFLSCGKYPEYPAELLTKPRFKEILNTLSTQFDYIFIDTAPVLAAADSSIIGALTDLNFLVVATNQHQPEEIVLTIKQLENSGIKIHGTVFNNLNQKSLIYGKYRYQHHSYYGQPQIYEND